MFWALISSEHNLMAKLEQMLLFSSFITRKSLLQTSTHWLLQLRVLNIYRTLIGYFWMMHSIAEPVVLPRTSQVFPKFQPLISFGQQEVNYQPPVCHGQFQAVISGWCWWSCAASGSVSARRQSSVTWSTNLLQPQRPGAPWRSAQFDDPLVRTLWLHCSCKGRQCGE